MKRFGANLIPSAVSRNPKEMGIEKFILYYRDVNTGKFKMQVITVVDDDSKHDRFTASVNLERAINRVRNMDLGQRIQRVVLLSDGSGKEYKSSHSFARTTKLARRHQIRIIWHFYATDDGKGLVDSIGYRFHVDYRESIPKLKLKARFVDLVVKWMNLEKCKFK